MLPKEENMDSWSCYLRNTLPHMLAKFYTVLGSNAQSLSLTLSPHAPLGLFQALGLSCLFQGNPSMGNRFPDLPMYTYSVTLLSHLLSCCDLCGVVDSSGADLIWRGNAQAQHVSKPFGPMSWLNLYSQSDFSLGNFELS